MPLIVDKEAVRMEILMAFERCIVKKPMTKITLRDIAEEAGMSHPKLLHYFENRDDLVVSYLRYTKDFMTEKCKLWFATHPRANYESNLAYMNAFMSYVARGEEGEQRPNATTQTYVLETMEQCLIAIYGPEVGKHEAEAMMILIAGTFICNYNGALTGEISDNIIGYLGNLTHS